MSNKLRELAEDTMSVEGNHMTPAERVMGYCLLSIADELNNIKVYLNAIAVNFSEEGMEYY